MTPAHIQKTPQTYTEEQDLSSGLEAAEAPAGLGMMTLIFHLQQDGHDLLSSSVIYTGMCGMNKRDGKRDHWNTEFICTDTATVSSLTFDLWVSRSVWCRDVTHTSEDTSDRDTEVCFSDKTRLWSMKSVI